MFPAFKVLGRQGQQVADNGTQDIDFDTPDHPLLDQMNGVSSCCCKDIRGKQERGHHPERSCLAMPARGRRPAPWFTIPLRNCWMSTIVKMDTAVRPSIVPISRRTSPSVFRSAEKRTQLTTGARAITENRRKRRTDVLRARRHWQGSRLGLDVTHVGVILHSL